MINLLFTLIPQIHGAGHDNVGIAKNIEAFLSFIESLVHLSAFNIFSLIMPGLTALNNLHPLAVHFPIALLSLFFISDLMGVLLKKSQWRHFSTGLLYLGTGSALITVMLGFQAAYAVEHNEQTHLIMLRHQSFGIAITTLAFILSLRRFFSAVDFLKSPTYGHLLLSTLLMILLSLGADLGGFMVYHHGVSVTKIQTLKPNIKTPPQQTHDHHSHNHTH